MTQRRQLMMGMPKTGKSTFIGALYHVVESEQVEGSLQLVDLGESRDYLVYLRDRWLGCVEIGRTQLGEEQIVELKLSDPNTGSVTELVLPDVSGETFRDQWEHRKSTEVFDELARQADGILFFVHPNTIKNPVRINQNKQIAALLEDDAAAEEKSPSPEAENALQVEWQPAFSPTQVKLIELIHLLLREPHRYPVSRIAVIVSAWDLIGNDYDTPTAWLTRRLPMLNQFLKANSDRVAYKVFGISAQGGELSKNSKDNQELLRKSRQAERVVVVTDTNSEYDRHDITAPIKWLMKDES